MKRTTGWAQSLTMALVLFSMLLNCTPRVLSKTMPVAKKNATTRQTAAPAKSGKQISQQATRRGNRVEDADDDDNADIPPFMRGRIDEESYHRMRNDQIKRLRGILDDKHTFNPRDRQRAIRLLERQESERSKVLRARRSLQPALMQDTTTTQNSSTQPTLAQQNTVAAEVAGGTWTPIGPAPIPNGQTTGISTPVSGRVTSIEVHPTNPNIVYVGTAQGGLYRSLDGGASWTPLLDTALSLAVGSVTIDPNDTTRVWVGTGEGNLSADSFFGVGVYLITNAEGAATLNGPYNMSTGGTDVLTGLSVTKLLVAPGDPNTIFVSTTSGIGGIGASQPPFTTNRGLYRATNALQPGGPTFTKIIVQPANGGNRGINDLIFEPGNPNNLYAGVRGFASSTISNDGGIWRSTNALSANPTFTNLQPVGTTAATYVIKFAANKIGNSLTILAATGERAAACTASSEGILRRSTDGVKFEATVPSAQGYCGGQCFYDIAPAIDPTNSNNIYLGGSANSGLATAACRPSVLLKSADSLTFVRSDTGLHADTHAVTVAPSSPNTVYFGSDGGVWRSDDFGVTWSSLNNSTFSATQFQSLALHPTDRNFTIGGTQDNGTEFRMPDGTWRRADFGDGGFSLIDQNAPDTVNVTMYHTYFNQTNNIIGFGRVTSTAQAQDSGWTFLGCGGTPNGINCTDSTLFYAPMALGPGNPNTLYFGSDRLYRSTDRGTTMQVVSQAPLVAGVPVSSIGISAQSDTVRIVGLRNGRVFATTNNSTTLTDVTGSIPARYISRAVIDPLFANTAYVTLSGFGLPNGQHVWKTTNLAGGGTTWVAAGNGIPDIPVSAFVIDPLNSNYLYAGTDIGVYASTDGGQNWVPYGDGLPRVAVFDMAIQSPNRILRIATHGRGQFEISVPTPPVVTTGALFADSATLTNESCPPANGVIDSGERVTVSLSLRNNGNAPTSNPVATLQETGGVSAPSGPQNYGSIAPGQTATRDFSFTANAACGSIITLTLQVQDGSNNFVPATYSFRVGTLTSTNLGTVENFDNVVAPVLPAGWTTSATGSGLPWMTTTAYSDTAPNSAATDASGSAAATGSAQLNSPAIAIPAASSGLTNQLVFRNFYNLEAGFDGGVLEISINGGTFQDILAAGGSFASGGYNGSLATYTGNGNPLAGRQAWTGSSGGFISTVINLPASTSGQNIALRFRAGYDNTDAPVNPGFRVDTISLASSGYTCNSSCTQARLVTTTTLARNGSDVVATITVQNQGITTATNVTINSATLGTTSGTPLPQNLGNLGAGQTATTSVTFANPGAAGTRQVLRINGVFDGTTGFGKSQTVTLP